MTRVLFRIQKDCWIQNRDSHLIGIIISPFIYNPAFHATICIFNRPLANQIYMMPKIVRSLLLVVSLLATQSSYGQTSRNLKQIDSLLEKAHNLGVFNGNLLVSEKGKIIYKKTIGWAEASKRIKLTEDYRFHIGSIAKEFNAVGIMMLKEQGKLSLEDKVSKYLPELPLWAKKISIRHLLQYTSGIPQSNWNEIKGDADNMNFLKTVTKLDFEPGTKYDYNNNDVFLQRRIIEKVTGLPYESFVMQKLFKPCGINSAIFDPREIDKLVAMGYNDQKIQDNVNREISGWPALNLMDFYRWSECINSFTLITPISTKEIITPFSPDNQTGLGHGTVEGKLLTNHRHDGTSKNYQALLISNATTSRTIILMTNNKQGNLDAISKSVKSILEGSPYIKVRRSFIYDFDEELENMNGEQTLALYKKIKLERPNHYSFDGENTLNQVGYFFLNKDKVNDAITIFTFNTKLFPNSANMFDSLGEAYYVQGNKSKALENYTIAFKLDPSSESAKKMIQELK
jgi:tetratricopeptide (TPR) repeat protein